MITEDITGEYDRFEVPKSGIPEDVLHAVAEGRGLKSDYLPSETEVEYWEIERVMENMDPRRDHDRALDAAIQRSMELYDDESYDLILTNIDYDVSRYVEEDEWGRKPRTDKWYRGEIDLMLVDIDENWVRALETKPHRGVPRDENGRPVLQAPSHEEKALEQYERQAFAFDILNEEVNGLTMHYTRENPVFESELKPEHELPDFYLGDGASSKHYWDEEAREKFSGSDNFRKFVEEFVLPANPMVFAPENKLSCREKEKGRFLESFVD